MKRWIHAADEPLPKDRLVYMIADECIIRLRDENDIEVKGSKTGKTYWLVAQEDGNYAIYFNSGNIWRDKSEDIEPLYFSNIKEVAEWLVEN